MTYPAIARTITAAKLLAAGLAFAAFLVVLLAAPFVLAPLFGF